MKSLAFVDRFEPAGHQMRVKSALPDHQRTAREAARLLDEPPVSPETDNRRAEYLTQFRDELSEVGLRPAGHDIQYMHSRARRLRSCEQRSQSVPNSRHTVED